MATASDNQLSAVIQAEADWLSPDCQATDNHVETTNK